MGFHDSPRRWHFLFLPPPPPPPLSPSPIDMFIQNQSPAWEREEEEGTQFVFQGSKKGEGERKRDFPWGGIRRSTFFSPSKDKSPYFRS